MMNVLALMPILAGAAPAPKPSYGGLENALTVFDPRYWGNRDLLSLRGLAVAALVILLILLPVLMHRWHRQYQLRSKPLLTFHQLASHVGMSLRDQWLLILMAHHQTLPSPLTLLLSRATLHHHAKRYGERLAPRRRLALMRRIAAMRQMLYD